MTSPGLHEEVIQAGEVALKVQVKLEDLDQSASYKISRIHSSSVDSAIQGLDPCIIKIESLVKNNTEKQINLQNTQYIYKGVKTESCDISDQFPVNDDSSNVEVIYLPSYHEDITNSLVEKDITTINSEHTLMNNQYHVEYSIKVEETECDDYTIIGNTKKTDDENLPDTIMDPIANSQGKSSTCQVCHKKFTQLSSLSRHSKLHSGVRPYSCDVCKKTFSEKGGLNMHRRIHSGEKPYQCDICKKYFNQKINLQTHLKIHTGVRPYTCEVCKKAFRLKYVLMKHMRIHSSEKPYWCNLCEKGFKQRSSLLKHLRSHSGKKPFACKLCDKAFSEKDSLQMHWKTHTGEKRFACDVCQKKFRKNYLMQIHMRIHSGAKPFSCEICAKQFRHKHVLRQHLSVHTGEKPFPCPVCEKAFRLKSYLLRHKLSHSKESVNHDKKSNDSNVLASRDSDSKEILT